jgi:hypothetical protein
MKIKRIVLPLILLAALFLVLHSTPSLALRTHVFFMGHPITACTSGVQEGVSHVIINKEKLIQLHEKAYSLTKAPADSAGGGGLLENYLVKRDGFLYFAEYIGYE